MKIVLDAGHGPNTPGKRSPDGLREYTINREIAYAMRDELMKYKDVEVLFTFSDSQDVPLRTRTDQANKWGADVFVSIHANALAGKMGNHGGIETLVYSTVGESLKLARVVQRHLIAATALRDRGVKVMNMHVLRESKMPAILIEHGFMDSYTDLPKLKTSQFRKLCAEANVKALAEFYGLQPKVGKADDKAKKEEEAKRMAANKKATGFTDVPANHRAAEAIMFLRDNGITSGFGDDTFRPDEHITRADMAVMLQRVMQKK